MTRSLLLVICRWLVPLGIVSALLCAPVTMASERAQATPRAQAMSHCADMAEQAPADHAPVKRFSCMGACLGFAPHVIGLTIRMAPALPLLTIPPAASLRGIPAAHDPPPPRTA